MHVVLGPQKWNGKILVQCRSTFNFIHSINNFIPGSSILTLLILSRSLHNYTQHRREQVTDMTAEASQYQLPPYFPLVRPGCESTAETFFQCLNENLPAGERIDAEKVAKNCNPLREAYEKCFKTVSAKLPPPMVRTDYESSD